MNEKDYGTATLPDAAKTAVLKVLQLQTTELFQCKKVKISRLTEKVLLNRLKIFLNKI